MWYKLLSRKAFDMHKFESFRACIDETKTKNSNYLYGHYYKKSWNSKLLCWGLDFIFFAQSLTQSIGLCVYAKSSNTRLAASSDAFCAYAVWFFFSMLWFACRVTLRHWRKLLHAQWDTKLCIPPPIKCQLPLFMSCLKHKNWILFSQPHWPMWSSWYNSLIDTRIAIHCLSCAKL